MLSYHAPGDRQRNWYPGYAKPMIEFKQEGYAYLFDKCKEVSVGEPKRVLKTKTIGWGPFARTYSYWADEANTKTVCYDYVYQLTDVKTKEVKYFSLTNYPSKNNSFERYVLTWKTVPGSIYQFPVYEKRTSNGTKVEFGTMDQHIEKNRIYKLEIIGIPQKSAETNAIAQTVSQTLNTNNPDYKAESTRNNKLKTQVADPTKENKVLYEYHFKTSKYNSMTEKLNAMTFMRKSKGVQRSDISHPDLTVNYSVPTKINDCLLYTSPSPRDATLSRMPSSA